MKYLESFYTHGNEDNSLKMNKLRLYATLLDQKSANKIMEIERIYDESKLRPQNKRALLELHIHMLVDYTNHVTNNIIIKDLISHLLEDGPEEFLSEFKRRITIAKNEIVREMKIIAEQRGLYEGYVFFLKEISENTFDILDDILNNDDYESSLF